MINGNVSIHTKIVNPLKGVKNHEVWSEKDFKLINED
jgi:hypothetical protein